MKQAEKADLSPMRSGKAIREPSPTKLIISLAAPAQAHIFMEAELMLIHTANKFLMAAFSEGLLDFDTIKKASESWKGKGRPMVTQFSYDQETQRKLIVANQDRIHFHRTLVHDRARTFSLLQNWKRITSLMSTRTFCNPDSILRKMLNDVGLILEILGAEEGVLLRLQQIRAGAEKMIHEAIERGAATTTYQQPASKASGQPSGNSYGGMQQQTVNQANSQPSSASYGGINSTSDRYAAHQQ